MDKPIQNSTFKPTVKMLAYANNLLDLNENLTKNDVAKKLKIDRTTIYGWYKNVDFINWLNGQAKELFTISKSDRIKAAVKKAKNGDFNFAKLIFEMEGEFTPTLKQDINIKVTEIIISHMVEVINKHVTDENIRKAIAEEFCSINFN